ncbi:DUF3618 domain-containing protein [Ornithinimicrobium tianjinense]|uniref:DUF3618 domain-containing protein n=1 Tax=Ornithinimicrobium tianjinense TaxID=1195761 RepID=A0A917BGI2_9MICO|nr:DUF3618 domain-containing protein [Ornithinimicrobium tianjinense]GGF43847.1 hypothetical protein GCM10011366_09500 [Ornithinimicrobium tianjinense]
MTNYPSEPVPTSDDPEVLRAEIEQTRMNLSRDVDALGEAASPGNVARRQADKAKDAVLDAGHSLKEKVMGSDDPYDDRPGLTGRASSTVGDAASSAGHAVAAAPAAARRQTRGNPLAAGLVALGAGWLVGSLMPSTAKERELSTAAKEKVQDSGVVEEAKAVAQDVVDHVKPQAQEAVDSVKQTASDSAQHVKDEARLATEDVKASAEESKVRVQEQRQQY